MIDIHTHILPGVDDGFQTENESLKMLESMASQGIKGVVLTPHQALKRGYFHSKETLEVYFDQFKQTVKEAGINIALYLGAEVDDVADLFEVLKDTPSLNGSNHVLIDFGMSQANLKEVCYELRIRGYVPIVAHVERLSDFKLETILALKAEGALLQVNAKHLIKKGSKVAVKQAAFLLKKGLIDVVGSDAHHIDSAADMQNAYALVEKKQGKAAADAMFMARAQNILGLNDV